MGDVLELTAGQTIWFQQTCRGFQRVDVPGTFVGMSLTSRRALVELRLKDGQSTVVAVHRKNVRPRDPEAVWK